MNTILHHRNSHAKRRRGPDQLGWQKVGCLSHWKGKATNLLSPLQRFPHVWAVPAAAQGAAHFNHCPLELKAWHSCCVALLTSMLTQPGFLTWENTHVHIKTGYSNKDQLRSTWQNEPLLELLILLARHDHTFTFCYDRKCHRRREIQLTFEKKNKRQYRNQMN